MTRFSTRVAILLHPKVERLQDDGGGTEELKKSKCLQSFLDDGKFVVRGQHGINPVDGAATSLHAAKPSHLALGKLVDGCFQLLHHFVIRQLTSAMEGEELVFQTIIDEIFGWNAFIEEALHFCHHAIFETLVQTLGDALATHFTIEGQTKCDVAKGGALALTGSVFEIVGFDFDSANGAFCRVHICGVVHALSRTRFQFAEKGGECFERLSF